MNPSQLKNQKANSCSNCGYDKNPIDAKRCQKCGKPLNVVSLGDNANVGSQAKPKPVQDFLLTPWIVRSTFGLLFLFLSWLIYSLFITVSNVSNSNNISNSDVENISPDVKLYNSIKDVPNVPSGTFNYGASSSFASLTAQGLHEAISLAKPNFRLRYTEPKDGKPGGKKGVAMLIDGQVSFTLYGASLDDTDYKKAQQRGFQIKQVPIALDILVVFTHKDIAIPGLSVNQIQDIYKGKLTNWKQIGGPNLPIVPFARDPKAANLLKELLGQEIEQLSSTVQFTRDYTETIRKVASTPGGISFGGNTTIGGQQTIRIFPIAKDNSQKYVSPFVEDGKQVNVDAVRNSTYPLTRRRFVVFRLDGTIDQLAGEAYSNMLLSTEGQQIIEKAGFIPLR
jgi:phosphate transport system substrate-binding protein